MESRIWIIRRELHKYHIVKAPEEQKREGGQFLMKNLKKLTILHSNDMHGDFLAE